MIRSIINYCQDIKYPPGILKFLNVDINIIGPKIIDFDPLVFPLGKKPE